MAKTRIDDRLSPNPESENTGRKLELSEEEKEWEEASCPICMEHPHNAVLLICSSHQLGCRPYMCNATRPLSNCLDKFCKSHGFPAITMSEISSPSSFWRRIHEASLGQNQLLESSDDDRHATCPFCRGEVYGYAVMKSARKYMNSKPRKCSYKLCEFIGYFAELRNHARSKHASHLERHEILNYLLDFPRLFMSSPSSSTLTEASEGQFQSLFHEEEQEFMIGNLFHEPA